MLDFIGGAEGNRTPDLCSAIAALSHLSYDPGRCAIYEVTSGVVKFCRFKGFWGKSLGYQCSLPVGGREADQRAPCVLDDGALDHRRLVQHQLAGGPRVDGLFHLGR